MQLQREAQAEYEEKLKSLNMEVQEMVKSYVKAGFPAEPEMPKDPVQSVPEGEQGSTQQREEKAPVGEVSRLTTASPGPPQAETEVEIEESVF